MPPSLESRFHAVVSGERRGPVAGALRAALSCLEGPYGAAVTLRNRRYDRRHDASQRVGAKVISVGNLTLGGTGKTPLVKWIARWLATHGARVTLISRGYRGGGDENDEAKELAQALPGVPHLQDPDRVAAARRAIRDHNAGVLLLDDGFQHRRIARDLDIVLLDATQPFGYGRLFPRGLLREPASGLRRADVVCLSRANLVDQARREALRREVARLAPDAVWCVAEHTPQLLRRLTGQGAPLDELRGSKVAAFCGLGNPAPFRATLDALGCRVVVWRPLPDHHRYTPQDLAGLVAEAESAGADRLVCTHKDLVKIQPDWVGGRVLHAVVVEMGFAEGEEELIGRLHALMPGGVDERGDPAKAC